MEEIENIEEKETEKVVVPQLVINDNVVTLEVVEVPLVINKEEVMIKMQQVTAGKRRELTKKYMSTRIQGQSLSGTVDALGFQIGMLSVAIIDAPFKTNEDLLGKFPSSVLDYLYTKYNNSFGQDEKKNK